MMPAKIGAIAMNTIACLPFDLKPGHDVTVNDGESSRDMRWLNPRDDSARTV